VRPPGQLRQMLLLVVDRGFDHTTG
jgi:hypothetical protein